VPSLWWPRVKKAAWSSTRHVPSGSPIDAKTKRSHGDPCIRRAGAGLENAARAYDVPKASIRRAMEFESLMEIRAAA